MSEKYQYFNGLRFTRDDKTGYYLNSTIRKRIHRYVWEYYNGEIPDGYQIHHKDGDKSNNSIENLELLKKSDHCKLHGDLLTEDQREWRRNNLNIVARPKAIEWHKSEQGHLWHIQQYEKMKDKLHIIVKCVCVNCGREFDGHSNSRYCSNKCRSSYRRKTGVDSIQAVCAICGKPFIKNKYSNTMTCSKSCGAKYSRLVYNTTGKRGTNNEISKQAET